MSVRVNDRLPIFAQRARDVLDDAVRELAVDAYREALDTTPLDKGTLRSESEVKKVAQRHWRVSFWSLYARFQEFGGDGKRRVRNYTTAGTGKHYLKNGGDKQMKRAHRVFKKHARRVR